VITGKLSPLSKSPEKPEKTYKRYPDKPTPFLGASGAIL
jgi:hypothetical protein